MESKIQEIYNNLKRTYETMSDKRVISSSNPMFHHPRASKRMIKRKMDEIENKYKLNNK